MSPSNGIKLHDRTFLTSGKYLRIAEIFDEPWLELPSLENPEAIIVQLQDQGLAADLFVFSESVDRPEPRFSTFHIEWDNVAVAPSADFNAWWNALPQESRKNVRRSQKRGVVVRPVEFTDELVRGIKAIYDETPFRQGRRFWHYHKELEVVRRENGTYLDRGQFIGAFLKDELIGFVKIVQVGKTARIMQILSMNQHFDKNVTNALVTATMEVCAAKRLNYLIYGKYIYGNKNNSSVTEFKRRNGFLQLHLPRYYIPLTLKGRIALHWNLHHGLGDILPERVIKFLLDTRSFAYERWPSASNSSAHS